MMRLLLLLPLFVIAFGSIVAAGPETGMRVVVAYDEAGDASRDVAEAVKRAAAEGKTAMVVFGANWCPDCRNFDAQMSAADLGGLLAKRYVVVKVDVGKFNKNLDVTARYGVPIRKGIPAVVLLSGADQPVAMVDGPKMEALLRGGRPALLEYFTTAIK